MFKNSTLKSFVRRQEGTVSFLIFAAIVFFAVFLYVVIPKHHFAQKTQISAQDFITQYPMNVFSAVDKMTPDIPLQDIRFNRPDEFNKLASHKVAVFHPQGGGAVYMAAPADVMVSMMPEHWVFNGELEVPGIGTSGQGGNDIVAYLVGITEKSCLLINKGAGVQNGIPVLRESLSAEYTKRMSRNGISDYTLPEGDVPDIDDGKGTFEGMPFGCFQNSDGGDYVYYSVVVER